MNDLFADAEIISTYTRSDAIRDGVLIDVSTDAREAGFRFPVALTIAAYLETVTWTPGNFAACQSESGRLWDVLMTATAGCRRKSDDERQRFEVLRVPNRPRATVARLLRLELHIGPGDDGAPVITIGLPGED